MPWPLHPPEIARAGDAKHGEYLLRLGGCVTCHTDDKHDGQFLAGGRALETPFGTFYPPNITPDPETGLGGWSTGAFVQAMTQGRSPGGHPLYPALPYPSYTRMTEQDLVDLKAYLDTVRPVANPVPAHDLHFPFGFRPLLKGWQLLFFDPGPFQPDPTQSESWNRGAYIVNGPGHCGECHTPRNAFGAPQEDRFLAGTRDGPDGKAVPNITPNQEQRDRRLEQDRHHLRAPDRHPAGRRRARRRHGRGDQGCDQPPDPGRPGRDRRIPHVPATASRSAAFEHPVFLGPMTATRQRRMPAPMAARRPHQPADR